MYFHTSSAQEKTTKGSTLNSNKVNTQEVNRVSLEGNRYLSQELLLCSLAFVPLVQHRFIRFCSSLQQREDAIKKNQQKRKKYFALQSIVTFPSTVARTRLQITEI